MVIFTSRNTSGEKVYFNGIDGWTAKREGAKKLEVCNDRMDGLIRQMQAKYLRPVEAEAA